MNPFVFHNNSSPLRHYKSFRDQFHPNQVPSYKQWRPAAFFNPFTQPVFNDKQQGGLIMQQQIDPQEVDDVQIQPMSENEMKMKILEIEQAIDNNFKVFKIILWISCILYGPVCLLLDVVSIVVICLALNADYHSCVAEGRSDTCGMIGLGYLIVGIVAVLVGQLAIVISACQWTGIQALNKKSKSDAVDYRAFIICASGDAVTIGAFGISYWRFLVPNIVMLVVPFVVLGLIYAFCFHQCLRLIELLKERKKWQLSLRKQSIPFI